MARGFRLWGNSPHITLMIFSGNEEEWLDFINVTLTKMKETGEYDKVLDRWFGPEAGALRRLFEPEK